MYSNETKKLQSILLALALLIGSSLVNAQEYIDIIKLSYSSSPGNTFEGSSSKASLQEINGDLTLPVKVSNRVALLTGVAYERNSTALDVNQRSSSVSGITLKLGANVKHSAIWSGTYMLLPKVASDLQDISNRDLQIGGALLMKNKRSDYFNYKFGVYANRERFGIFIVPMVGFYFLDPTERFEAKVLLPLSVDLNYKLTKRLRAGINFKGQVRSYNLNDSNAIEPNRYLSRSTNELTVYLQYEMKNGVNFQAGMGHSFARSYRIYNEGVSLGVPLCYFGDHRKQHNSDFSDGWIFKATVYYRLKLGGK